MDIIFSSSKQERIFCNAKELRRKHGTTQGDLIKKRLDEIRASINLSILRQLPQARPHELKTRPGIISLDLNDPYRLIIEVQNDPLPEKPDGGLDWSKVDFVKIVGVENTHE